MMRTDPTLQELFQHTEDLFTRAQFILRNREESEDIVQEVLLKIWQSKEKIRNYENIRAYAMLILRNKCIDRLRSRKYHDDVDALVDGFAESETPEHILESKETVLLVEKYIKHLPENQGYVLKLRHAEHKTISEIAHMTNLTDNHVRVLLSRARRKVKKFLDKVETI